MTAATTRNNNDDGGATIITTPSPWRLIEPLILYRQPPLFGSS
jgi:hypothetical protein